MLEQYQTEIFALVALLVVVLIYIMIKNKSSQEPVQPEIDEPEEETAQDVVDEYDNTEENVVEEAEEETAQDVVDEYDNTEENVVEEVPEDEFDGKEEGSFDNEPNQREADNTPPIKPTHSIKKREVPPHEEPTLSITIF